ncbi:MAG: hypothetical protein ABEJ84_03355, partial [Halodesulfurarchaeum sp.]
KSRFARRPANIPPLGKPRRLRRGGGHFGVYEVDEFYKPTAGKRKYRVTVWDHLMQVPVAEGIADLYSNTAMQSIAFFLLVGGLIFIQLVVRLGRTFRRWLR